MNTVLYFTADWCNPCQKTKPFAEELIRDGANIKFIDVDSEIEMVKNFKIMSVPTYIVLKKWRRSLSCHWSKNKRTTKRVGQL